MNPPTDARRREAQGWRWRSSATGPIDAPGYRAEVFIAPSPFNGVHGLAFDGAGRLYVASLARRAILRMDLEARTIEPAVAPPDAQADDVAFGPDGTMYWTDPDAGVIRAQNAAGIRTVASGLAGINGIAFRADGRLYASSLFTGDALYEIDPTGRGAPRQVLEGIGGLNGFAFGPDDRLYGPLWFRGEIARIDVDAGSLDVVTGGFMRPSAVKVDAAGQLWMVDSGRGVLARLDRESGTLLNSIPLAPSIDNLAIDSDGRIYVTNMADNSVHRIDPASGAVESLIYRPLNLPSGLAIERTAAGERLHIADQYAYRVADIDSGDVREVARRGGGMNNIPCAVSIGRDRVFLTSLRTHSLEIRARGSGEHLSTIDGFGFPYQATEVAPGILVADHAQDRLVLLTETDGVWRRTLVGDSLPGATAVLASQDGSLYIADAAGTIWHVDRKNFVASPLIHGLDSPEGVADLSRREILVSEVGRHRLVAIDRETGAQRTIASNLPIGLQGPDRWPRAFVPTGIAVDAKGCIYVSSDIECAIFRLRPGDFRDRSGPASHSSSI